jgi:hypothetical protein
MQNPLRMQAEQYQCDSSSVTGCVIHAAQPAADRHTGLV